MIATAFNHGYDTGDYGPVYTRWDARSQAIITRADYIRRHKDCTSGSHTLSQMENVSPGPDGAWLVHLGLVRPWQVRPRPGNDGGKADAGGQRRR